MAKLNQRHLNFSCLVETHGLRDKAAVSDDVGEKVLVVWCWAGGEQLVYQSRKQLHAVAGLKMMKAEYADQKKKKKALLFDR